MPFLYEHGDMLNRPIECFYFDTSSKYFPVHAHWHFYMELIYMYDGKVEASSAGEKYIVEKGDMMLFHPKAVHSISYCPGSPDARYAVIKLDISRMSLTPSYAPKLRSIFLSAEKKNMTPFFAASQTEKMRAGEVLTRCIEEMRQQKIRL